MFSRLIHFAIIVASALTVMSVGGPAQGQESGEYVPMGLEETDTSGMSTNGIFNKLPNAYRIKKIVRPGEQRTSEWFYTTAITGAASATALTSDKSSHAGKFVGVRAHCISMAGALCQVPVLTKNGTPITDSLVLQADQSITIPFANILTIDTSDSLAIQGSATITGAGASDVSYVAYEMYTPRSFQTVVGSN